MIGTWLEASARSVEVKTLGTQLSWAGHVCEFYFQEFIQAPQRLLGAGEILGIYDVRGGVGETLRNLPKCCALNKIFSGELLFSQHQTYWSSITAYLCFFLT